MCLTATEEGPRQPVDMHDAGIGEGSAESIPPLRKRISN